MIRNNQNGRRRGRGGARPPQQGGGPSGNYGNTSGGGSRIDTRQRGNATQLLEKYKAMARDATQNGDRVQAEFYMQYADHYFRVLNEFRARDPQPTPRQTFDDDDDYGAPQAGQNYAAATERDDDDDEAAAERSGSERSGGERSGGERASFDRGNANDRGNGNDRVNDRGNGVERNDRSQGNGERQLYRSNGERPRDSYAADPRGGERTADRGDATVRTDATFRTDDRGGTDRATDRNADERGNGGARGDVSRQRTWSRDGGDGARPDYRRSEVPRGEPARSGPPRRDDSREGGHGTVRSEARDDGRDRGRRESAPRYAAGDLVDEAGDGSGLIGLPGPATLTPTPTGMPAASQDTSSMDDGRDPVVATNADAPVPRKRGRPRKVVVTDSANG